MTQPSINITVDISRKEYEALTIVARRSDRSRAGQVRRWIRQALENEGLLVDSQNAAGDVMEWESEVDDD